MSQQPHNEQSQIAIQIEQQHQSQEAQQLLEMIQIEKLQKEFEQNSQRMIEKLQNQQGDQEQLIAQQIVKNPVSPYMIFVTTWKDRHPNEKFNMSSLGQIWKTMSVTEKQPFETIYRSKRQKYEEYMAAVQINNPNGGQEQGGPKYLFPLHRIRAIMKQDTYYSAKVEATAAMSKTTEYFAEFFLEEIKKLTEGKNRIDSKVLYDCINNNRSFSFLECLIEQFNKQNNLTSKDKKPRPQTRLQFQQPIEKEKEYKPYKPQIKHEPKPKMKSNTKPTSAGQMSLDSFVMKQR